MSWPQTFAALKHPNYRLWFFGQLVSLLGTWTQMTAQSFLVYELTKSPAYLGYVSLGFGLPAWLFMLYGGVVADRLSRRALLIAAQIAMMLLAFVLAALTFAGLVRPWHIVVLVFFLGLANAFDAPARQAFVFELVTREDITNAVALNSTLFNLSAVAGPAAAGIIYMLLGPAWCFAINGISFVAVIGALCCMRLPPRQRPPRAGSVLTSLTEGVRYIAGNPRLLPVMGVVAATALFGFAFVTLLPAWAVNVLGGDATTNGFLQSARGAGAVLGALAIASLGRFEFRGALLSAGTFALPLLLLAFAAARSLPISLVMLTGVGLALVLIMNLANALLQTLVSDDMRGRVMSMYSLTHFGLMPIGGLLAGMAAEYTGEAFTVVACAVICLGSCGAVWLFIPRLRKMT